MQHKILESHMDSVASLRRQTALNELRQAGWLQHIEWLPRVDSTNNLAKQWVAERSLESPVLFIADQQTAGRGRSGNEWWSPTGCLMMTLAIPPSEMPVDPRMHPQLAFIAGVALAATADTLLEGLDASRIQLKWPNDVYFDGRKLAGILIETLQCRPRTTGFAIGIGINTQIDWSKAPTLLRERAVCLSSASGHAVECETVLLELVQKLREQLHEWREQPEVWMDVWRRRCLLTGCLVRVRISASRELVGRCDGIDTEGHLLLRTENQLHTLTACEILDWSKGGSV